MKQHNTSRNPSARRRLFGAVAAVALAASAAIGYAAPAQAEPKDLNALLKQVKDGWTAEKAANKKRVAEFKQARDNQKGLLRDAKAQFAALEKESAELEQAFTSNEAELTKQEEVLRLRLGTMGELFGVIRQVAGDAQAELKESLVSAQYPGREKTLIKLATSKELPKVEELNALWFALQKEMVEQGKVSKFTATMAESDGSEAEREVIRVGVFNAVSDGKYLDWNPLVGKLQEIKPQPQGRYTSQAAELQATYGSGQFVRFGLDFTRGSILRALVQSPDLKERISQGGVIGYMIIALGIMAGLFGLFRFVQLLLTGMKVNAQRANLQNPATDNPLGRILRLYASSPQMDAASMEHRLEEAVMQESAKLDAFLWIVKIVQIVAPLMGLLGTVTGMIGTFQSITLFGTGDPKRMAGGISEALVTTMLGLIVAIALVFLNSWLKTLSKRITDILDQQSAGLVAQKAEQEEANGRLGTATA